MEGSALLATDLELEQSLVAGNDLEGGWTIQVVLPDHTSSLLAGSDTLISLENVENIEGVDSMDTVEFGNAENPGLVENIGNIEHITSIESIESISMESSIGNCKRVGIDGLEVENIENGDVLKPADMRPKLAPPPRIITRKGPNRIKLPYEDCKTDYGYVCPNCDKIYNARKNLVRHVKRECGKEPNYSCPICEYKNYRRNELRKHVKNKHNYMMPT